MCASRGYKGAAAQRRWRQWDCAGRDLPDGQTPRFNWPNRRSPSLWRSRRPPVRAISVVRPSQIARDGESGTNGGTWAAVQLASERADVSGTIWLALLGRLGADARGRQFASYRPACDRLAHTYDRSGLGPTMRRSSRERVPARKEPAMRKFIAGDCGFATGTPHRRSAAADDRQPDSGRGLWHARPCEPQGRRHTVTVAPEGYVWEGQAYSSLSAIARAITGTAWSGPRFFALKSAAGQHDAHGRATRHQSQSSAGASRSRHTRPRNPTTRALAAPEPH
jgi:hypothetical protein